MRKYRVTLDADERAQLERILARGKGEVRMLKHAIILMKADESPGPTAWTDEKIAEAVGVGASTVYRVRERFVEEGFEAALRAYKKGSRTYATKLDGRQEAQLIALACSAPPEGHGRWTLRLLAGKCIELKYVDKLSPETVRQTLKKRVAAPSEKNVVHSAQAIGGICPSHGRRARFVPSSL
jgi:transposase